MIHKAFHMATKKIAVPGKQQNVAGSVAGRRGRLPSCVVAGFLACSVALDAVEKGFESALASAGFKEGVNLAYDRQNAQTLGHAVQRSGTAPKPVDATG